MVHGVRATAKRERRDESRAETNRGEGLPSCSGHARSLAMVMTARCRHKTCIDDEGGVLVPANPGYVARA